MKRIRACLAAGAVIGIALLFASTPESEAGGYGGGQAVTGGTTEALAAGGVTGTVGWLVEDSTTGSGTGTMSTTGSVGAIWDGMEYQHKDDEGEGGLNVFHMYDWDDDASGTLLSVVLQSNVTCSGSADVYSQYDPSWWWDSTNTVEEDEPTGYAHVPGEGSPDLYIHWFESKPAQAAGGDSGDQCGPPPHSSNNVGPPPPYGTLSISRMYAGQTTRDWGTQMGTTQLPPVPGSSVIIQGSWGATAKGCVDNARVHSDKLELSYNFLTSVGP